VYFSVIEGATQRILIDSLTDEFERVRKFVSLMGMPRAELRVYLLANSSTNQYSRDEVAVLWSSSSVVSGASSNNSGDSGTMIEASTPGMSGFDDLWIELSVAAQKQASANQQQFLNGHAFPPSRRSSGVYNSTGATTSFSNQSYGNQ
jgi:hypothetical protein